MNAKAEQHDPSLNSPMPLFVKRPFAVGEACPRACNASSGISGASGAPDPLLTL